MKKWFLAACLPLMIVSCDIFGFGEDDDDDVVVDTVVSSVPFDYEDKVLSGDTLVLMTYVRLVDPEVLFNNMPMEIEVIDNLPGNNASRASDESIEVPPVVGGIGEAYFIKVRIPESCKGYFVVRIDAARADSP